MSASRFSPYLLLIFAGIHTMVVEFAVPRIIAPAYGNTMFSWTAIIAVVMFALALGYHLGGRWSISPNRAATINKLVLFSIIWTALFAVFAPRATGLLDGLNIITGPLVAAFVLAAPPAFANAALVPLIVSTIDGDKGAASGQCFAWSTVGSIAGVVITGYVLLPYLGIKWSLLVACIPLAIILATNSVGYAAAAVALPVALALGVPDKLDPDVIFDKSNAYHRIRIKESGDTRMLYLDSTAEGGITQGNLLIPVIPYQRSIKPVLTTLGIDIKSAYYLGGGSFSIPRFVMHLYPGSTATVAEIDADVVQVNRDFLELGTDINILEADGRLALANAPDNVRYDLILNDAFHGVRNIPFHLLTREFIRTVHERINPGGAYIVNVIGHRGSSRLVASVVKTLESEFSSVRLHVSKDPKSGNTWIVASDNADAPGDAYTYTAEPMLLTDDRAPVEYLIAGDFVRAKFSGN